ncbi:MAG: class I mannose-6-phosphate isomerase [Paludibacteraceae bacterium]|nr:class I mannose-6-phosphate isomerase [Paludibacteraceae bacterium]
MLYPFKFKPQCLDKIWGGHTIEQWYDKVESEYNNVGEAWVISDFDKYPTEVCNGAHTGDTLHDLLEVYLDELVGGKVYDVFGTHFPLLMKFIDATQDLSIQVHPDDDYALDNEDSLGKNEMWYVMPSPDDASIYLGWKQEMNEALVRESIAAGTLADYLQGYKVKAGDVAYLPAGTVHAMCRNTIVAEIQENSDLTYRLFDYNRVGNDGKQRPLHIDKALEVMNLQPSDADLFAHPQPNADGVANLRQTPFFTTNLLQLTRPVQRDYAPLDSFVAYMCTEGSATITALDCETEDRTVEIRQGEGVLIPASLNDIVLTPKGNCNLLEIYIEL